MSKKKLLQESKTKNWEEYFTMYFYSLFLSRLFCVSSVVCVFFPSTFIVVNTKQGDVLHQQAVPIVCICPKKSDSLEAHRNQSGHRGTLHCASKNRKKLIICHGAWANEVVSVNCWYINRFPSFFIRNHRCLFFGSSCWAFLQFFH